ncbi:MAG: hypothetical protein GJ680_06900 [Alteromonadaceae bacterium]|nr:hypothetical protein [Alteromonadaceae bacterium]
MQNRKKRHAYATGLFAIFGADLQANVTIDGQINTIEWQHARVFEDYIRSFPNTGEAPKFPTKTYLTSDEKGIYVAFENYQPHRSRKYSGHDQYTSADFNMVFVDFNNDGDTAYEFVATLGGGTMDGTYSRGNQSNRDWDGDWQVRVSEQGDYWYSEFFIPWTTASYRAVSGQQREISIYFQRQNVIESEAYSFPDTNRGRKNFTYEFYPVTVNNTQNQSIKSSAYITSNYNLNTDSQETNIGLDVTWKPSANQQLIATAQPDFGQVESDELIVNYSAIETLRTDKRPFFTINQSLFDVRGPNDLRLVNTRRIGANAIGNSEQLHDIEAAAKYVANYEHINAGLLVAREGDVIGDDGKDFTSLRWYSSFDKLSFGQLYNYVADPTSNRTSLVVNQDLSYRFNDKVNLASNIIYSYNKDAEDKEIGKGITFKGSYVPVRHWQNNLEWTYLDAQLNVNDLGYMQRNNISTLTTNSQYDHYGFAATSPIRRTRTFAEYRYQRNTMGLTLRDSLYLSYYLQLKNRHGFRVGLQQKDNGSDDLITRQLGFVDMPAQRQIHLYYGSPSPATFSYNMRADYFQEGESEWAQKFNINTTSYFNDRIRLNANYTYIDSPDWLIGNSSGEVKRYQRKLNMLYAKLIARLSSNSDITLTTQWYGLKAAGIATENNQFSMGEDFNVSQFALQARYRKRLENGSSLYFVYSHNGFDDEAEISFGRMASNAISEAQQKSITAKINWVF